MYRVHRAAALLPSPRPRGHSPLLSTGTLLRTLPPVQVGTQCRRPLSYNPTDHTLVDKLRVIAINRMLYTQNRQMQQWMDYAMALLDITNEDVLKQRGLNKWKRGKRSLQSMRQVLEADAASRRPVWTAAERRALAEVIKEFDVMFNVAGSIAVLAAIGLLSVCWKLSGVVRSLFGDEHHYDPIMAETELDSARKHRLHGDE